MMQDGDYTYYSVQHRRAHESPWLKPDKPLKAVKREEKDWGTCGGDYWGRSVDPHIGKGNDWRSKYKPSADDFWAVRSATGTSGWRSLKFAARALKRLRKDDAEGLYDTRDTYGKLSRAVRHEFRIIKVHTTQETKVITVNEIVDAL